MALQKPEGLTVRGGMIKRIGGPQAYGGN